ncbi:MAG: hypothetical protein PGN16_04330 [Sphingomonas phyllosphaerae]|uniref:hypothetical protein n=1 Tax=Sphingomonas phyllosphaerae TaxID=257003 RepID=UPI002FF64367
MTLRRHLAAYLAAVVNVAVVIAFVALLPWGVIAIWCAAIAALFGLRHGLDRLSRSIGPTKPYNRSHEDASA